MPREKHRYYLELRPESTDFSTRMEEIAQRRAQAVRMVAALRDWVRENQFDDVVASMEATPFGQLHITCPFEVMQRIQDDDCLSIIAVRQANVWGRFAPSTRFSVKGAA